MISINNFLNSSEDGVLYTGHASLIARLSGKNYIFDYVRDNKPYGDLWVFFPDLTKNIPWDKIDGVFVSHVHQDHYDSVMLKTLNIPVYIIGGRHSFEETLKKDGVTFKAIPPNVKYEIDSGIYVYGVLHHANGVDASCYIGNENLSIYHGNDNYTDNISLSVIATEFGSVDIACVPYAYINWYPQLLENLSEAERELESKRLVFKYYDYAIEQANILNAKRVIPFGANLTYNNNSRSALNLECKTPLDFQDYVVKKYGVNEGLRFKAIFSGDVIVSRNKKLVEFSADRYDKESYRDLMQKYLESLGNTNGISEEAGVRDDIVINNPSINLNEKTPYPHLIIVAHNSYSKAIAINTFDSSVDTIWVKDLHELNIPLTLIRIKDAKLFSEWMSGEVRMEEVIGSRKFTIFRSPNIYDEKVQYLINTQ
jgi:L-ascorbate metabolism protein UlaG (beta-lactamase superfamily)